MTGVELAGSWNNDLSSLKKMTETTFAGNRHNSDARYKNGLRSKLEQRQDEEQEIGTIAQEQHNL